MNIYRHLLIKYKIYNYKIFYLYIYEFFLVNITFKNQKLFQVAEHVVFRLNNYLLNSAILRMTVSFAI